MRGRPKTAGCKLDVPLDVPWGASQNDLEAVEDILSATSLGSVRGSAAAAPTRKGSSSHKGSVGHGCSTAVTAPSVCPRVRQKTSTKKPQQVPAAGPSALSNSEAMRPAATDAEEFVLDDRDLLRLHDLPYRRKAPQRCLRLAAHLQTVSIIDTLSALAQGAADRDYPLPKSTRGVPAPPRYQRKAAPQLSYARRHRSRGESTRQCMSDSEVKGGDAGSVLSLCTQPASKKAPSHQNGPLRSTTERTGNPTRARGWTKVPDWIRAIFRVARKGDLDALAASLRDMDTTLIWNLSDSHGNNLWHICAACNHLRCFQWLCQKDVHHVITDENHSNLTPVGCAVKHGNVQIVQWLVTMNIALDQLNPPEGQKTLLHLAAKYGQDKMVQWLAEYTNNNALDINRKDGDGNTAVHLAVKYGHVTVLKALILHGADITTKNDRGLRPYALAVQNGKPACADYLLTIEACMSLSSEQIITEGNFQCLQQENADMRNGFKELLVFTKRLLRRQEEMLHYMQAVCNSDETLPSDEAESDFRSLPRNSLQGSKEGNETKLAKVQYLLEQTQSKVLLEEEARLQQLEEKWRRLRTNKCVADTRSPLDLVRSHFAQALAKCSDPNIQPEVHLASSSGSSVSNYSEESAAEDDDKRIPAWLTGSQQPWDQELLSHNKVQAFLDSLILPQTPTIEVKPSKEIKNTGVKVVGGSSAGFKPRSEEHRKEHEHNQENVSLKFLFEKNPELRQEGKTCSVLEILDPSGSEGEEEFGKKGIPNCGSGDSSTSSFRSTKGYKNSTIRATDKKATKSKSSLRPDVQMAKTKDNGHSILLTNIAELPDSRYKFSLKIQQTQDCEHGNLEGQQACSEDTLVIDKAPQAADKKNKGDDHQPSYPEPDLIRGTKQASPPSPPGGSIVDVSVLNNSVQDSAPSQDGGREEEAAAAEEVRDNVVALERQESVTEAAPLGATKKRSGFLLKFSLKGRWTSKQKQQQTTQQQQQQQKKCEEISPEEFRETYTRNEVSSLSPSSHESRVDDGCLQEHIPFLPQEILHKEPPPPMPMIPMLRREPPPVPPHAPSIASDAPSTFKEGNRSESGLIYGSSSLARPESILSKITGGSLSRPASSASQTEDHRRSRSAGFVKGLSSNELMLHTPDSSVAGRQSPAPSEVSKTESALSPPSDVSKTESARHPPHLGKIEEIVSGQNGDATPMKKGTLSPDGGPKNEAEVTDVAVSCLQDADMQQGKMKKVTLSVKKIRKSSKPWYEVSDEEDILIPDKYQTARARSSSDDEADVTVVA